MGDYFLKTFFLLFVLIDPPGLVPIFTGLTQRLSLIKARKVALKASIVSFFVLLFFAFVGDFILDVLKISEGSFKIAGGILLLLTAIDMVVANHMGFSHGSEEDSQESTAEDIAVFPLAIPLISGPGSLISITVLMREVEGNWALSGAAIGALMCVIFLTFSALYFSAPLARMLGRTGANVLTRVFGIILAGLAIQMIVNGISDLSIIDIFKR